VFSTLSVVAAWECCCCKLLVAGCQLPVAGGCSWWALPVLRARFDPDSINFRIKLGTAPPWTWPKGFALPTLGKKLLKKINFISLHH